MKAVVLALMVTAVGVARSEFRFLNFKSCKGTKTSNDVVASYPTSSRTECALMCMNDDMCAAASYCNTPSGYSCQMTSFYTQGSCSGLDSDSGCDQIEVANLCQNDGTFHPLNDTCDCVFGFVGHYCHRRFRGCAEVPADKLGVEIQLQPFGTDKVFTWECQSGQMLLMVEGKPITPSFDRPWAEFKEGIPKIGDGTTAFFMVGLELLHYTTSQGIYDLRIQVIDTPTFLGQVWYRNFSVDSEANGYALHWASFEQQTGFFHSDNVLDGLGAVGDSTKSLQFARFGTHDNDVNNCAGSNSNYGFWYNSVGCGMINPSPTNELVNWPTDKGGPVIMYTFTQIKWDLKLVSFYETDNV